MLHIVNGDSVGDKLRQGSIQGDILVWREIYSVGPVFKNMTEYSNRAMRAQYLERHLGIPQSEYVGHNEAQENFLKDLNKYKEIILWFEHDLFDQTMLCYLLHRLANESLGDTKLSLLCIGEFPGIPLFRGLGQLSVEQLQLLAGTWKPIGKRELELGSRMWGAYASPDPVNHMAILQADTSALPFVHDAFEAHLSRLPSVYNGLGVVEQTTLHMVASGVSAPYDLFHQVGNTLNVLGMGDLEYWHRLARMSENPYPLLRISGNASLPTLQNPSPSFHDSVITITELGRQILAGEEDWAAMQGIEDFVGGLHLQGQTTPWRWDGTRRMVVQRQA